MASKREKVRLLNDEFRAQGPTHGGWMITNGVDSKGSEFVAQAASAVRTHDSFTLDDDPYEEHDFGSFELGGEKLFWKIDYYDQTMTFGSATPDDPAVTRRVLTIMLASEY